jgi:hypothetical protein
MKSGAPSEGNPGRPGGPASRVADTTDKFVPHDCIEAVIVWALLSGEIPTPNTPAFRALLDLAEALALRRLRAIAPVLEASNMWFSIGNRYAERHNTYDTPPRTAAQIMAQARHSWAKVEREIAARAS